VTGKANLSTGKTDVNLLELSSAIESLKLTHDKEIADLKEEITGMKESIKKIIGTGGT
tara:strand:- start:1586 stop:1759 length:174 start_codon:yes stop_codon:yes gene_type:complete